MRPSKNRSDNVMRFYHAGMNEGPNQLDKEESKHCLQVLRHEIGDVIEVVDGNGSLARCQITATKNGICSYEILETTTSQRKKFSIELIIAPTKNVDRMEWMVEKLGELGVDHIKFIKTQNSERKVIRLDRLEKKAISAMKQSGNVRLPQLTELQDFKTTISRVKNEHKYVGYLGDNLQYLGNSVPKNESITILIGPEGDFAVEEVQLATDLGFKPVSLGQSTLRTETAGLIACGIINFINQY